MCARATPFVRVTLSGVTARGHELTVKPSPRCRRLIVQVQKCKKKTRHAKSGKMMYLQRVPAELIVTCMAMSGNMCVCVCVQGGGGER